MFQNNVVATLGLAINSDLDHLGEKMPYEQLQQAQARLKKKLRKLNLEEIPISEYTREYLRSLLHDVDETLGRFTQVIRAGLKASDAEISELNILEFGGGAGLLSLLALEAGANKVIYNDIFKGSCDDVIQISKACDLGINAVICGDHAEVVRQLNRSNVTIDLVLSYDVIEHVYDVSEMFLEFRKIITSPKALVFGSGANIKNPFYVKHVSKIHQNVELNDRKDYSGHKERDSLESYFKIRKKIISSHAPELVEEDLNLLASNSRGLIKDDIIKFVDYFCETNEFNYLPGHITNTCDPLTGNWCEQLLNHKDLLKMASHEAQEAHLFKGRYTVDSISFRSAKRLVMNLANLLFLKFGFTFSPFYILVVTPRLELKGSSHRVI